MSTRLTSSQRAELALLRAQKTSVSDIAVKLGCSTRTVSRQLRRLSVIERAIISEIASKDDVLLTATQVLRNEANKPLERLAAGKMLCLIQGWLSTEQAAAAQVNVNILNARSIAELEAEYRQISGRDLVTAAVPIGEHSQPLSVTQLAEPPTPSATADPKAAGSPQREGGEGEQVPPEILPGFSGDNNVND